MDMGNLGFPNMGFSFPNTNMESSDDSDSDAPYSYKDESDSSASYEESDSSSEDAEATVDSAAAVTKKKYHSCYNITHDDVRQIEMNLDFYEYISVIFLLFDREDYALQEIRSMIAAGPQAFSRDKLSKWIFTSPDKWNYKLIEALAVIQNYQDLMKLGFCEQDINAMIVAPVYISRLRKVVFSSVCDYLEEEQAQELIDLVRNDARFKDDVTLLCDPSCTEFHFLFWASQKYIDFEQKPYLNNLTKHLKLMGLQDIVDKINEEMTNYLRITHPKSNPEEDDFYKIKNPNKPGLLLIINNANFEKNRDKRQEFQHILHEELLDDRVGSAEDVESLRRIFEKKLKFDVFVKNDVFHDQLEEVVYNTVSNCFDVMNHSIIILCVLSHGDEGVVFGANSIPIKNKEIINSVSGSSRLIGLLAGIPKVIIIQACQGKKKFHVNPKPKLLVPDGSKARSMPVTDGHDLQLDGFDNYDPDDRIICMATIEGFVAVRSLTHGTLYIQELCRCVQKYYKIKHFYDIMTKVHQNLRNGEFRVKHHEEHVICMIPEIISTLGKPLFLTTKHRNIK